MWNKIKNGFSKVKNWIIAILGLLVLVGGAQAGWEVIKDSKIRPVIRVELDEASKTILEKVSDNSIGLNKLLLDRAKDDLTSARQQYYEVWKDEKKYGPEPQIINRKQELKEEIQQYEERVKELKDKIR
jgi:hypothetical protein